MVYADSQISQVKQVLRWGKHVRPRLGLIGGSHVQGICANNDDKLIIVRLRLASVIVETG